MKAKLLLVILIVFSIFSGCENSFEIERNDFEDPEQLVSDVAGDISDASEQIAEHAELIGEVASFISNRYSSVNRDIENQLLELGHTTDDLKYHYSGVIYKSYNWEAEEIVEVEFDQDAQLVYIRYEDGTSARYEDGELVWEYDGETTKQYNSDGKLSYIYYVDTQYWESYSYDDNGNLIQKETSLGYTYTFDTNGNLTSIENRYSITYYNENKQIIKYESKTTNTYYIYKYDAEGRRYYTEDSNGNWHKYTYGENGKVIKYENSNDYWYTNKYNSQGKVTYYENSNGYWYKQEYNSYGKITNYENSQGYWTKYEYNQAGYVTYYENSQGYWYKYIYNSKNMVIYRSNSNGYEWYSSTECPNKECLEDTNSSQETYKEVAIGIRETTNITFKNKVYQISYLELYDNQEVTIFARDVEENDDDEQELEIYETETFDFFEITVKDLYVNPNSNSSYVYLIISDEEPDLTEDEDFECYVGKDEDGRRFIYGKYDEDDNHFDKETDMCESEDTLAYNYCDEDFVMHEEEVSCPNGCEMGACINSSSSNNSNSSSSSSSSSSGGSSTPVGRLTTERLETDGTVYIKSTYTQDTRIHNSAVMLNNSLYCITYDAVLDKESVTAVDFNCSTPLIKGVPYDVIVKNMYGVFTSTQIAR